MSTETKDALAKTPSKGFSLRSRLLGIPPEGTPEPSSPDAEEASKADTQAEKTSDQQNAAISTADASASVAQADSVTTKDNSTDENDEGDEPPRVGMALAPKRSLLSMAFGISDKKAKAEKAKFEEAVSGESVQAREQEPDQVEPIIEPESEIAVEAPSEAEAPREVEAPVVSPVPLSTEPARGRLFSMFRGEKATKQPEPAPDEPSDLPAEAPSAEAAEKHAAEVERVPSPIEVDEPAYEPPPFVRFGTVTKTYDGINLVVKGLDLDIAKGEFLTLLGPSGSGKTTTLMMLAGFEQPTSGDILLNGVSLNEMPPHKRGLGFVFQNYALFPHMTVQENVSFPLEVRRIRSSEIKERVAKALGMVELTGFDKRKPHQLSGGQQQRVAMARSLVFDPELVLMDEPLGALDKHLREQMQYELKRLHRELGVTVVYVTHDQSEALTLSDRIAVFHDGVIQQLDTPTKIYDEPANAFVAGFIGENNALPGKVVAIRGDECVIELIGGARVRAINGNCETIGQQGVICVRPEHLSISAETTPGGNHVAALIEDFIFHGDHVRVKLSAPGMSEIYVKTPARGASLPAKGVAVTLSWEPASARAFVS